MNYQLVGDAAQAVLFQLQPGENLRAPAAALLFCNDAVSFEARTQSGLAGGVARAVAGSVTGQSVSLAHFECIAPGGMAAFAAPFAGKIQTLEIKETAWLCQRDSFLCASGNVLPEVAWARRFGTGLFGGEGFALHRLNGEGTVWIQIGGAVIESTLDAGQNLRVDAGCIAALESTVSFDVEFSGGFKNSLMGGEGVFHAILEGPGKVILQTHPLSRLAGRAHHASNIGGDPGHARNFGDIGTIFGA
ncbi:MAG TPA: AIM24 family protein [Abditibacteriaceae bacterium]|jgi:uncharacterized protein (AIM24 family)